MSFQRFEDIVAWQRAREFTRLIYEFTRQGSVSRDFGFASQIQRAAVSIMSNIAEGFELRSPRQFARLLMLAKGSCAETRSLLYVALDVGHVQQPLFESLMERASELARILSGLLSSVRSRDERDSRKRLGTRNSELGTGASSKGRRNG